MDMFRIRPLSERDLNGVIEAAGGRRAHQDADSRSDRNADYILGDAVIELKILDEEGLEKPIRQTKLAVLFKKYDGNRPVIVLDRERLPQEGQREFDRILEGPIKRAVSSARKQLNQTRLENSDARTSVLLLINNGYTALDHDTLSRMASHRIRNDTTSVDGVVVAGCYFYSDMADNFFLWPMTYIPINLSRPFTSYKRLHSAWSDLAESFMTRAMREGISPDSVKGPVVDMQFDIDDVSYVKPAPPMGKSSDFFRNGRPRKNSSGIERCPCVALTFPDMHRSEWNLFRAKLPGETQLCSTFESWQRRRARAEKDGRVLQPFVPVLVTFEGWKAWKSHRKKREAGMHSIGMYANELFDAAVQERLLSARERKKDSLLPARYVLTVTEEIGQDRVNDVSHIFVVTEHPDGESTIRELATNQRVFHEYALALASAYAVANGIENVMWLKDLRYAWDR